MWTSELDFLASARPRTGDVSTGRVNANSIDPDISIEQRKTKKADLLKAIAVRLQRSTQTASREFRPDFSSHEPLIKLGLTPRAAEALLWAAQGKTNADIAVILGISESTVKTHVSSILHKLGLNSRTQAAVVAQRLLSTDPVN